MSLGRQPLRSKCSNILPQHEESLAIMLNFPNTLDVQDVTVCVYVLTSLWVAWMDSTAWFSKTPLLNQLHMISCL